MSSPGDAGTCFELYDSVGSDFDISSGTAQRTFIVGQTEITPAMPLGFPNLGEVHPRYPGLFCDRINVIERVTPASAKMGAIYSTNGRFTTVLRRPGIDLQRGYLRIDPERAEVQIPFLVATVRTIPIFRNQPDGSRLLTDFGRAWEWVNYPRTVVLDRELWSRSVDVLNLDLPGRLAIHAQIGQIHTFPDGLQYQMLAPSIQQRTVSIYTISYQWRTEPTLPEPGLPPFPGDPDFPLPSYPIPPIVLENYYATARAPRPPFYNYQVVPGVYEYTDPSTGSIVSIPDVYVVDGFPDKRNNTVNPNGQGWQNLPGSPLNGI